MVRARARARPMWVQKLIEAAKHWHPPQQLDEQVLAKIEQQLSLATPDNSVRTRLAELVFEYQHGGKVYKSSRQIETTVRKRLKAAKKAATKLLSILNEEP